jgi:glycerol-3-phosphate dehydrogenase
VKGSHIVVPRIGTGDHAFILQNDDRRVVFVIPFEERFSLIGTTDIPFDGDPRLVAVAEDEIAYLCRAANRYLAHPIGRADIVWSYAGVRPLHDDGQSDASAVTRDYVLDLDAANGPPLLSIYGGKITTYRRLAVQALALLSPFFPQATGAWTAAAALPGGDMPRHDFAAFLADAQRRHAWIDGDHLRRIARRHGTRLDRILGDARRVEDLGPHFGHGFYAREVDHLRRQEWARESADILWRRTKLGLHLGPDQRAALEAYLAATPAG